MRWIWDWDKYHNSHRSKSIRVTKLIFCQNGVLLGRSFWPKDSLVTLILFELWLLWYSAQSQIHHTTLYKPHCCNGVLNGGFILLLWTPLHDYTIQNFAIIKDSIPPKIRKCLIWDEFPIFECLQAFMGFPWDVGKSVMGKIYKCAS